MYMCKDGFESGDVYNTFTIEWDTFYEYQFLTELAEILNDAFPMENEGTRNVLPNYDLIIQRIEKLNPKRKLHNLNS